MILELNVDHYIYKINRMNKTFSALPHQKLQYIIKFSMKKDTSFKLSGRGTFYTE